jgi:hypothetical protein
MYNHAMRGAVILLRICGRKDSRPRRLYGQLGMVMRELGGRSIRVLQVASVEAPSPPLAELMEPVLMVWCYDAMEWQGYENNYGQWTLQRWRCEMERPAP